MSATIINNHSSFIRYADPSENDLKTAEERKISKKFEDLTLDDLEVISTLGTGGFGRVELVLAEITCYRLTSFPVTSGTFLSTTLSI
jgi:hypothetical protein